MEKHKVAVWKHRYYDSEEKVLEDRRCFRLTGNKWHNAGCSFVTSVFSSYKSYSFLMRTNGLGAKYSIMYVRKWKTNLCFASFFSLCWFAPRITKINLQVHRIAAKHVSYQLVNWFTAVKNKSVSQNIHSFFTVNQFVSRVVQIWIFPRSAEDICLPLSRPWTSWNRLKLSPYLQINTNLSAFVTFFRSF